MSVYIKNMFDNIAGTYDKLNSVLSFGVHHYWRRVTVSSLKHQPPGRLLDCATGTGDLAIAFKNKFSGSMVTGLDFSYNMLSLAGKKLEKKNHSIGLINGDMLNLPFSDRVFDVSSVAFGIRNVDDVKKGLSEMARVTKESGKVLVLEFGKPMRFIMPVYYFYSKFWMPFIGKLFSGDSGAYSYLPSTALAFPCRDEFLKIMLSTGKFKEAEYITLSFGIAYLYVGTVGESNELS